MDLTGRNLVIGVLKYDEIVSKLSILMACKEMSTGNHIIVTRLYNEGMHLLWPMDINMILY